VNIRKKGFALPTVLIASVVMLMVLATAVSVTVSVRSALQDQYYNGVADSVANSGTAFAQACLDQNDNTVTWTDAKPLKPNTDCYGNVQSGVSAYVSESSEYRTYFVVSEPEVDANSQPIAASSQGFVEILRESTGIAWRVFSSDTVSALGVPTDGLPVGASLDGYWTTAPEGYLLENGQAVSRTTYADLFAVIGTTFGAGDGSTTFNVPDSRGRVTAAKSTDTPFDTLGEKGGSITHTHDLSADGWARIGFDVSNTYFGTDEKTGLPQWGATRRISDAVANTTTATQYSNGARLDGTTDSDSSLQPYITVTRVIKY